MFQYGQMLCRSFLLLLLGPSDHFVLHLKHPTSAFLLMKVTKTISLLVTSDGQALKACTSSTHLDHAVVSTSGKCAHVIRVTESFWKLSKTTIRDLNMHNIISTAHKCGDCFSQFLSL